MRYADAAHLDVGSFYARNPCAGKTYRLLGYLGIIAGILARDEQRLAWCLLVLVLLWTLYRLWRIG